MTLLWHLVSSTSVTFKDDQTAHSWSLQPVVQVKLECNLEWFCGLTVVLPSLLLLVLTTMCNPARINM